MRDTDRLQRHPDLVSRRLQGETVLVPVRSNVADLESIYLLNPVASWIWDRLDGAHSVEQLVDEVVARFDTDRERARQDALAFLDDVVAEGLARLVALPRDDGSP
ncbi:MAG: PqqD family protein [Deltaproteobacteria bacterium]|nr:PqqD family protein [Deltaproteobacteria bacterium]